MKKLFAVIVVLAITLISSVALAEISLSGSIDTRGRAFNNLDNNKDAADYDRDTQTRVRLNFDGKAGDAKAKVTVERDFETWGGACAAAGGSFAGVECPNGTTTTSTSPTSPTSALAFREAWISTPLVGPLNLKGGHVLAQLGNGWFFRSMKYGTDAWILYADIGPIHMGFVNGKIQENAKDRDLNMNVGVLSAKLSDTMTIGMDLSQVNFARPSVDTTIGATVLYNVGVNANLGLGPVKLKAEVDLQTGRDNSFCVLGKCSEFKGNQFVIEGSLAAGPANINFTVARGSGDNPTTTSPDVKTFIPILDADPHYAFLYEYKMKTAGFNYNGAQTNSGFSNTTAIGAGADVKFGPVTVGANLWWLAATEDVNLRGAMDVAGNLIYESDLGIELDARVNWKISDAVSWNTTLGYFVPGDAYLRDNPAVAAPGTNLDADETTGIQTVLSMKF